MRGETGASGCSARWRNSRRPAVMVVRDNPVAAATAETPPQPRSAASAAAHCRRVRSSITGPRASNLRRTRSMADASCMPSLLPIHPRLTSEKCSGYRCASPNGHAAEVSAGPDDAVETAPDASEAHAPEGDEDGASRRLGYAIILDFWRELYHPVFRKGTSLFSGKLGREVRPSEALSGAPIELILQLYNA